MRSKLVLAIWAIVSCAGALVLFVTLVALIADQLSDRWAIAAGVSGVLLLAGLAFVGIGAATAGLETMSLVRSIRATVRTVLTKVNAQTARINAVPGKSVMLPAVRAAEPERAVAEKADEVIEHVLVLALGERIDSEELVRFAGSVAREGTLVVTDRAELVAQLAAHVSVEFLPSIPSDLARTDVEVVGVLTSRLVELASEHGTSSILIWEEGTVSRRLPLGGLDRGIQVHGGAVVRQMHEHLLRHQEALDRDTKRRTAEAEKEFDRWHSTSAKQLERSRRTNERAEKSIERAEKILERSEKTLERSLGRTKKSLERSIDDVYKQGEALTSLYRILLPSIDLPPLRGWAISPDLALHIVRMILAGDVNDVIETGSGSSTVIMALALERVGRGHVTSLEHDADYAAATRDLVARYGVESRVTVHDAPLVDHGIGDEMLPFYDLSACSVPCNADLLLVDGPPAAVGNHSRFPALPVLVDLLTDRATIVLDDGRRADEQEIAARWADIPGVGEPRHLPVERSAIVLDFDRSLAR